MAKAKNTASKLTLFHSELVKVGAPVTITVMSEAKKSPDAGKPDYVDLLYKGKKRQYVLDRPELGDFFKGQISRSMSVMFEGGRGNEVLTYVGEAVAESAGKGKTTKAAPKSIKSKTEENPKARDEGSTHEEQPAQTSDADRIHKQYEEAIRSMKLAAGKETVLCAIACDAAEIVAKRHEKKHGIRMTQERIQGIAIRIMIALAPKVASLPTNLDKWLPVEKPEDPAAQI
jgi:hypothetical protein